MAQLDQKSPSASIRICSAALSDVGFKRQNNEDSYLIEPTLGLYAVADGMGGHSGGEVASRMAVKMLAQAFSKIPQSLFPANPTLAERRIVLQEMQRVIAEINNTIYTRSLADDTLRGMGCTLDVALVRGNGAYLGHIGDSRIYLLRQGRLKQLTQDHNLYEMLIQQVGLSKEEAANHPHRNVLTRALGPAPHVEAELYYFELRGKDRVLLCSDGVHGEISEAVLKRALGKGLEAPWDERIQTIPDALIQAALDAGGRDNATAVVLIAESSDELPAIIGDLNTEEALRQVPLFADLSDSELLSVQKVAEPLIVPENTVLFEEGSTGDTFFIVLSGEVEGTQRGTRVLTVGPGGHFGTHVVLDKEPRMMTARTISRSCLLRFHRADYKQFVGTDSLLGHKLALLMMRLAASRIRELTDEVARARRELAECQKKLQSSHDIHNS